MRDGGMSDPAVRLSDRRNVGWFWMSNRVVDLYGPVLGPSALAVYTALVRRGNRNDLTVVRVGTLGKAIGLGETTVRASVQKLERLGLIEVYTRIGHDGQRLASEYVLCDPPEEISADWATKEMPERAWKLDPNSWKKAPSDSEGLRTGGPRLADPRRKKAPSESEGGSAEALEIRGGGPQDVGTPPSESGGHSKRPPSKKKSSVGVSGLNCELVFRSVEAQLSASRDITIELLVAMGVVRADDWEACSQHVAYRSWVRRSPVASSRFTLDRALAEMIDVS